MLLKISGMLRELKINGIYSSSGEIRRVLKANGKTKVFDEKKRLVWAIDEGEIKWLMELMRLPEPVPKEPKEPKEPIILQSTPEDSPGGIPWVLILVLVLVVAVLVATDLRED